MNFKRLVEIVDKNVDQQQLLKDLGKELVLPFIEEKLSKLDIIPGTTIDNEIIKKVVEFIKDKLL